MKYSNYIGLQYKNNGRTESGIDCWGLVRLFYKQELNIDLPSYGTEYFGPEDSGLSNLIQDNKIAWTKIEIPAPGCVVLFNILGEPVHVGIYLGDNKFLHARSGQDSAIESLDSHKWSKRVEGFYIYTNSDELVDVTGAPHPFKTAVYRDVLLPGTSVEDISQYIKQKFSLSDNLYEKLVVLVDGVPIPKQDWSSTVLISGQQVSYKTVAEGRGTLRLLLTLVVAFVAWQFAPQLGAYLQGGGATAATVAKGYVAVASLAINFAGSLLINAIAPIVPPSAGKDPGSTAPINGFSGASNQANRFGAIPVVLGKVRTTAMLGAVPYIETLTDTNLLHLSLVWGFGPLKIDDIRVGAKSISELWGSSDTVPQQLPVPTTISGYYDDDVDSFDKLYPADVEQKFPNIELVNNPIDGNPPAIIDLEDFAEEIDIALTFPEGMRAINIRNGDVTEATSGIEITIKKQGDPTWSQVPTYFLGNYSSPTPFSQAYTTILANPPLYYIPNSYYGEETSAAFQTFQWHIVSMEPGGGISVRSGVVTDNKYGEPSAWLLQQIKDGSYGYFTGTDGTLTRLPQIPNGSLKIYTICIQSASNSSGYLPEETVSHLSAYQSQGLALTTSLSYAKTAGGAIIYSNDDTPVPIINGTTINISAGRIVPTGSNDPVPGQLQTIFTSRQFAGATTSGAVFSGGWSQFLKDYYVWDASQGSTFDKTAQVVFPYRGYYEITASTDDEGTVLIDGATILNVPRDGWRSTVKNWYYSDGENVTRSVRLRVLDTGGARGGALTITYTANAGMNILGSSGTTIVFGADGLMSKRRDAFNYVYKLRGLPRAKYQVRVRRTNENRTELEGDQDNRYYTKTILQSVTGYNKQELNSQNQLVPIRVVKNPPRASLARTYIRVQSTNKVNGTIEGVNALVQTIAHDWDRKTQSWNAQRVTNNPASLFLYVLMHPANAYRLSDRITNIGDYVDLNALAAWHEYCQPTVLSNGEYVRDNTKPWLSYNNIVTNVTSVLDILREIAAAGKASPNYVDGKWTVVVDKPRSFVTQHFTPHNSWGFEATKALPNIPDAFRIVISDESRGYQANEIRVYNNGKTEQTAEIFEELNLPGVTDADQAIHLARWHLAQLKARPELYTLNVDFEYLVCNRGDLVRVSHDVPMWGTATGRIKTVNVGSPILELTEPVYLESTKSYNIRIRNSSGASILKSIVAPATSAFYSSITLSTPVILADNINSDDLFMLGEISKESQELVVLSVEPLDNASARLTLVDYSPQIYTANLETDYIAYNSNITSRANYIVTNVITVAPTISGVISDSSISEEISPGIYSNSAVISITPSIDLTVTAERLQVQVIRGDLMFDSNSSDSTYTVSKESTSVTVRNLLVNTVYKVRARYTNSPGTISGPWSDIFYFTNSGRTINYYSVPSISLDLEGTYIVASPPNNLEKPTDFKTYEYRLYKDTGTEDFWELDIEDNDILVTQSLDIGRFNLLDVTPPRISEQGITYRVACRALDNSNNYSAESALGTIVVATIK